MTLTAQQIRERLSDGARKHQATISEAIRHEQRLCFHAETALNQTFASPALSDFLRWVQGILPRDKYHAFTHLMRFPVPTVELTEQIFAALEKVFDGRNPVFSYQFTNPEAEADWQEYRTETLKSQMKWREKGMEALKHQISSILIVDLPEEQVDRLPEPYWYWLPIANVIDYDLAQDGNQFEFIAFSSGDNIAAFDDQHYRLFTKNKDGTIGALISETPHDLGYCPAHFFWSKAISEKAPEIKESPITKQLGELDQYLFRYVSEVHLDTYAPYPIYWGFATDCDYEQGEPDHKIYCDGGFLRDHTSDRYVMRDGKIAGCPVCSKNSLAGAGSYVEIDPPGPANDNANLRDPVGALWPEVSILEYNSDKVQKLKDRIYRAVTGYGGEPNNDQAINEKQVVASFESRADVVRNLKTNFEKAQTWTDSTICRLRYGSQFVTASISYGTEFHLYSAETLLQWYQEAKKEGADDITLDSLRDQYLQTKHKNNPDQYHREKVLFDLDPLRHLTKSEAGELYGQGVISFPDYYLKVNFSTLIARFERENISVESFGSALEYDKKIESIRAALDTYINQPEAA